MPPEDINNAPVKITGPDAHHATNVLRLKKGQGIVLFDGERYEYSAEITSVKRSEFTVGNIQKVREAEFYRPRINLFAALIPKFDFIVEKATELGVSEIHPVITERTQIRIKSGSNSRRIERWMKVAIAACMQSGRIKLPELYGPAELADTLKTDRSAKNRLLASLEKDAQPIYDVLSKADEGLESVDIFIGPPADFTNEEYTAGKKAGLVPVTITRDVLKSETAAISALAIVSSFFYSRSSNR